MNIILEYILVFFGLIKYPRYCDHMVQYEQYIKSLHDPYTPRPVLIRNAWRIHEPNTPSNESIDYHYGDDDFKPK